MPGFHLTSFRLAGLLSLTLLAAIGSAQAQTRIYIANDDHTDYLWTADAETYNQSFVDMLDYYIALGDQTAGNASPYRSRFNTDGNYWLWNYERKKSLPAFKKLIAKIKDGTISSPLNTLVSCYGGTPTEAVLRGMYYPGRLERRFAMRFPLVNAMENQTLPLGLASLFSGAGAKYSWRGVCGCVSQTNQADLAARDHEIYYWTGKDGRRILMKWHSLSPQGNMSSGGYAEAFNPVAAVNFLDTDTGFLGRYRAKGAAVPFKVRGAFGFGWDALDRKTGQPYLPNPGSYPQADHFHIVAQNMTTATRQVIASNQIDFFQDFEKEYAKVTPSEAVTYGNEWELYAASMVETTARVRRAMEKLRTAELVATLVSRKDPTFLTPFIEARDQAFTNLGLYWEHDWTADGPVSREARAAWQVELATQIEGYANSLTDAGLTRLGGMLPRLRKAVRFYVVNPLSWTRSEFVDRPYVGPTDIHVRDLLGSRDVPHQFVTINGVLNLRFLATDVPSTGYRVFEILPGPGSAPKTDAATIAAGGVFENSAVRLVVARDGAIRSFVDKRRGSVELAQTIDGLMLNDFAANRIDGESFAVVNRGPVSVSLRAISSAGVPHTTTITLYRDSDRGDIQNEISQNFADVRHWAFSFNLASPTVRTEELGGININKLKSQGGDYADKRGRYDYVTVNHFADITSGDGQRGVTLSNADLSFAKLGRSRTDFLDSTTPQINMLAGGQVDGVGWGIQGQNGAAKFLQRFALRAHGPYDQTAAMKFALEHQNPFTASPVLGAGALSYPEVTYSLLEVKDPNLLLWSLKPSEEGISSGIIARFWNLSDQNVRSSVSLATGLTSGRRTTHIETNLEAIALNADKSLPVSFTRQQIQTYRLVP